ncbi:Cilia- and flagella-associated protein 57 [Irineochytrium annulatum]|nr:Cilia- and flagella-associated protein 57 [Irineochytrium annulatum]
MSEVIASHVFGLNREVRNNVTYLDEQTILYPAGTQLVQYNVEQKIQRFLPVNEGDGITTMHISSGQAYAAVAVKSIDKGPFVIILDLQNLRRRKILMPAEGALSKNLLCHCWINDVRIIAGTEDSKLLIFDSGDLILEISYVVPMSSTLSSKPPCIGTVTSFAGGVMAGTSTGVCVLFERTDDTYLYKKNKEFLLEDSTVGCIALSPAEDMAVCTLGNSQIYVVTLDADSSKGEEIKCDRLAQPFHNGHVLGMDTCARKPLIATCGADKSVRIWNYVENTIEVIKYFDDEPLSTWSFETIGNLKGHSGKVRSICWSQDDSKLVSCGLDGNVFDWNISSLKREGEVAGKGVLFTSACYTTDAKTIYAVGSDGVVKILVTKSDLKDNQKLMIELRQRVEALKSENETQLRLKDLNYSEKLKELTDKYMTEIEGLKQLTSALQNDRAANELNHKAELDTAKIVNGAEVEEVKTAFNVKIAAESEKFQELSQRTAQLKSAWEKQINDTETFHSSRVTQITDFYRKRVQEKIDEIQQLRSQFSRQVKDFEVHLLEIEEDANHEVLQIGYTFETKLKVERESLKAIKEENQNMRSRFEKLTTEIEDNKGGLNKMFTEERRLHSIIKGLEKDIIGVKREMQERDDTIQDKEKRIYDLKKKNQELEKFKFVLDYKIAELKKQVEPREKDIVLLSRQIKEMDDELHQYHKGHDILDTTIQDLVLKLRATQMEACVESGKCRDIKTIVRRIQNDVQTLSKDSDDINDLKHTLISTFQKYNVIDDDSSRSSSKPVATKKSLQRRSDDGGPLEEEMEEARQREHLERTIATLRHKLLKGEESRYTENLRIMQENVVLISEINILRKDYEAVR